ncbi:MAG TPA: hypothetical protein DEB55_13155, partial [Microbacterium sp.]|nr:hypothetical protein [Microbacterium sp.]
MEQLRVIGTEDDRLVVATEAGDRFALALDDNLGAATAQPVHDAFDALLASVPSLQDGRHGASAKKRASGGGNKAAK